MEYSFEFAKARIYINSQKKSLADIQKETGCDVLLNGGLYNMTTFNPLCHLKADGKVYASDQYKYWGYGWDNADSKLQMVNNYATLDNYICCVALVKDGKATSLYYSADVGGKRGRTAIGTKNGKTVIFCSIDGSADAMTPEELQQYCLKNGWKDAIMLDSGGSSQCITPTGKITSTRKVHNVLCFWTKGNTFYDTQEEEADVNGFNVKAYSKSKNGNEKAFKSNGARCTYFKVREFACQDGSDPVFIAPALVDVLEKIRAHFGKPTTVTSGFRTAAHNAKPSVGGSATSQHLYGLAADIHVSGVAPATVAAYAETLLPNKGGIGIYSNFTHVDVRETKSRWKG